MILMGTMCPCNLCTRMTVLERCCMSWRYEDGFTNGVPNCSLMWIMHRRCRALALTMSLPRIGCRLERLTVHLEGKLDRLMCVQVMRLADKHAYCVPYFIVTVFVWLLWILRLGEIPPAGPYAGDMFWENLPPGLLSPRLYASSDRGVP